MRKLDLTIEIVKHAIKETEGSKYAQYLADELKELEGGDCCEFNLHHGLHHDTDCRHYGIDK